MKKLIITGAALFGLTTLGALAVSEAAEASTARYCGTTADGFPGLRAVGPTSCGSRSESARPTIEPPSRPSGAPACGCRVRCGCAPTRRRCSAATGCTAGRS
jgi:hypothetical protein